MTRSLVFDRIFRGLGRLKKASGTSHPRTFRRMDETLTTLYERGRLDLIKALMDGSLTPVQLFHAFNSNTLDRLPTADDLMDLGDTMTEWATNYTCSKRHRESLLQAVAYLAPEGSRYAVGAIAARLRVVRVEMEERGHAVTFNRTRSAAQSFIRDTRQRHSALWREVAGVETLPVTAKRETNPLKPAEFAELWIVLPECYRSDAWNLAHTGMRPAEYWGEWSLSSDRLTVRSAKQRVRSGKPAAYRSVPRVLVADMCSPGVSQQAFAVALKHATDGAVKPYDLRRSFANWLESAGIPRTRRKAYLGHSAKDVTDLYEAHDISAYLDHDATRLRNYLVSAIVGPCYRAVPTPEAGPKIFGVPRFVTPSISAPSRNRTENLLIKSQLVRGLEQEDATE